MKVLLIKDVYKLGRAGDVKSRRWLWPQLPADAWDGCFGHAGAMKTLKNPQAG